ncbi:MAG: PSD1 and planctomycete cytochrome C domain-containing protein, partial [Verrucomicrobiota bacterium]
ATAEQKAFFNSKVLPILEASCFSCHGGEDKLKGEFRITSREGLIRGGELGPGLDLQQPGRSLVLEMLSWSDADYEMPPKGKLPDAELAILQQWVEMGAPYDPAKEIKGAADEHAGFVVTDADRNWWAYKPVERPDIPGDQPNPIDAFIDAKIDEVGLAKSPRADAPTVIRRAFYNLIGLPPSFEEMETWETRFAQNWNVAISDLIDDLLARPQYGEKWARHWLDLMRYADTNGFERDNPKPHIWRYRDYVVSAFNADVPYNRFILEQLAGDELEEVSYNSLAATGYHRLMQWDDEPADGLQHKYDVLDDNVRTTTEAFLATTVGCARCHDHKADPVSQKDYFAFMSFFHGVSNYSTRGSIRQWAEPAEVVRLEAEKSEKLANLNQQLRTMEQQILAAADENEIRVKRKSGNGRVLIADATKGKVRWRYTTNSPDPEWNRIGFLDKGWPLTPVGGFGNDESNNLWNTPDIWMNASFGLKEVPKNLDLRIYHESEIEVFLNGKLIFSETGSTADFKIVSLDEDALAALQTGKNFFSVHCRRISDTQYIDIGLSEPAGDMAIDYLAMANKPAPGLREALKAKHNDDVLGAYVRISNQLKNVADTPVGTPLNTVAERGPNVAPLHVHVRGSAHAKGDLVEPAFPEVVSLGQNVQLAALEDSSGRRRALAEWIASPENPLTARVMVNRLWQHQVGRGICRSTSDFGRLGEKPTHPEFLDYLASEFIANGWSLKAIQKLLMTSEAWQRSSAASEAGQLKDPRNDTFWRGNRRRLSAEELRDSLLGVSGQLNLKIGGPSVYPPIPDEVRQTASRPDAAWGRGSEEDAGRRSLYVYSKRSLREPFLADFDAADTDVAVAVRFETIVPTQALGMLNSAFVNDQATRFAKRLESEQLENLEATINRAYELALTRPPTAAELVTLTDLHSELGEDGLQSLCLIILNLNEFAYLD